MTQTSGLDLNFLSAPRPELEAGHFFLENVTRFRARPPSAQQTIAKLDLNYYIPCRAQQQDDCVPRPGQDGGRRFPYQRRCGTARDPGGLYRYRHPECAPVRVAGTESRRVRTVEGLQRKHCGVDQRGRDGGGSRRPHRILELADGSHVRAAAMAGADASVERSVSRGVCRRVLPGAAESRASTICTSSDWQLRPAKAAS